MVLTSGQACIRSIGGDQWDALGLRGCGDRSVCRIGRKISGEIGGQGGNFRSYR